MKTLLISLFFLITQGIEAKSINDSSIVIASFTAHSVYNIHTQKNPCTYIAYNPEENVLSAHKTVVVTGAYECENNPGRTLVSFIIDSIEYHSEFTNFIFIDDSTLIKLVLFNDTQKIKFRNEAYKNYNYLTKVYKKKALDFITSSKASGIFIHSYSIFSHSEYSDATDFSIKFYNSSKKPIKYITFFVKGYNPVNDLIIEGGKSLITLKGVGPIEPKTYAEYTFEYVWTTNLLETCKISTIKIQYMDGTFSTITVPSKIIANNLIIDYLPK